MNKGKKKGMSTTSKIHAIAGLLVFVGTLLGLFVNKWWLVIPLFVGANLFQYAFSGVCPLEIVLKKLQK